MSRALRVVVADDTATMQHFYETLLPKLGHEVLAVASTGAELVEKCDELKPDLVITDIKMPDMDGLEAAAKIYEKQPMPIIVVSSYHEDELIQRAAAEHVLAYLLKPLDVNTLAAQISIVMRRFEEFTILRMEANHYKQSLQDRKLIERAKGILMRTSKIEEHEAFRRMQKAASRSNKKLVEIAQTIIDADAALSI
jgi:two-component system, response regulator PdtaR